MTTRELRSKIMDLTWMKNPSSVGGNGVMTAITVEQLDTIMHLIKEHVEYVISGDYQPSQIEAEQRNRAGGY